MISTRPLAAMKSAYAPDEPAHSAARKKVAIAPALPTGIGLNSGHARHTAAAKAAAHTSRPTSGVGGERSGQLSSGVGHSLRGSAPIHQRSTPPAPSSASQPHAAR